jgi:hypothetical protein
MTGQSFTYSLSTTPFITSISPNIAQSGQLTIDGSNFGSTLGIFQCKNNEEIKLNNL